VIVTELYHGQGLGNQLWSYVVTRTLAIRLGYEFGIMSPEKFKGHEFLNLDFGKPVNGGSGPEGGPPAKLPTGIDHYFLEKERWLTRFSCDVRGLDPDVLRIKDNTKIEGYFQAEQLIEDYRAEIKRWLTVKPEVDNYDYSSENICVLNVRGGEYKSHPDLILQRDYWLYAMKNMRKLNDALKFVVVTDDLNYSKELLPELDAVHFSIGSDFSIIKNAHYLVISNSSFAFFPAWISDTVKFVIAPKYWARHNVSNGFWACEFNIYSNWHWQDRSGILFTAAECLSEYKVYKRTFRLNRLKSRRPIMSEVYSKNWIKFRVLVKKILQKGKNNAQ
jgi:hypothetical protein